MIIKANKTLETITNAILSTIKSKHEITRISTGIAHIGYHILLPYKRHTNLPHEHRLVGALYFTNRRIITANYHTDTNTQHTDIELSDPDSLDKLHKFVDQLPLV